MLSASTICLAIAIYFEARSEPLETRASVADVIMNRAENEGTSVCKTLVRPGQFSWSRLLKKYESPSSEAFLYSKAFMHRFKIREMEEWRESVALAKQHRVTNRNITHFHSNPRHPPWTKPLKFIKRVGTISFYANVSG